MVAAENASSTHAEAVQRPPFGFPDFTGAYKAWWTAHPVMMAEETLRFAAHRLEEQAKLVGKMSQCRTLSEAAETQRAFFDTAVHDYIKEAETIAHQAQEAISFAAGSNSKA